MASVRLLEQLARRQTVLLSSVLLGLVLIGWFLLDDSGGRLIFLSLLTAAGLGVAGLQFWWSQQRAAELEEPLRELIAAQDHFEEINGKRSFTSVGGTIDELAEAYQRLRLRLKQRIHELEEDRQQLRAMLGGMVEGVVALDVEQRVLFANERAAKLLQVDMGRLVGRRIWEVVRQRPLLDVVQRALESREPQQEEVFWNGDTERSLTVHAASLPGEMPHGAVVVLHDTSDLRRLERLRQEFVANVSHELKTPLSVIKVCVETLVERGAIDDPTHRGHFLEQIGAQSERLHLLILDLLALARIESGAHLLEFGPVPLGVMVESCVEGHLTRAEAARQSLVVEPPQEGANVEVWVDEESLAQIVHNLLDNALKYTPDGGRISVSWEVKDEFVDLSVTDTGIGIPEQDLPRIFERFYRVDKARSRELGGTGLGLSIVKHLAQELGGSVHATSEIGHGSRFVVRLQRVR